MGSNNLSKNTSKDVSFVIETVQNDQSRQSNQTYFNVVNKFSTALSLENQCQKTVLSRLCYEVTDYFCLEMARMLTE